MADEVVEVGAYGRLVEERRMDFSRHSEQMRLAAQEIRHLRAVLARVEKALEGHMVCDRYTEDDPITCGWKRAVADVQAALNEA